MKKLTIFFLSLVFAITSLSGQVEGTVAPMTKADYLKKSRGQRTGGFVLLGTGGLMLGIAAPGNIDFTFLPVLVIGGAGCILGSIPLFISAGKNKRIANAMSAGIQLETIPAIQGAALARTSYPAISIRLNL